MDVDDSVTRWHRFCLDQFVQADLVDIVLATAYTVAPEEWEICSVPAPNGHTHCPKGYPEPIEVGFRVERCWAVNKKKTYEKINVHLHYGPCGFWSGDLSKFIKEIASIQPVAS